MLQCELSALAYDARWRFIAPRNRLPEHLEISRRLPIDSKILKFCTHFVEDVHLLRDIPDSNENVCKEDSETVRTTLYISRCLERSPKFARKIIQKWNKSSELDRSSYPLVVRLALNNCESGLKALIPLGIFKKAYLREGAFEGACAGGHIYMLKWLVKNHMPDNIRSGFCLAVDQGHLEICKWLHCELELTIYKIRLTTHNVMVVACINGKLEVAQWLTEQFGYTAVHCRVNNVIALRESCSRGHLEVAQWLVKHFSLTVEDCSALDYYALRNASRSGHLDVVKWLLETFDIKYTGQDGLFTAIRNACRRGHLQIAEYLENKLNLLKGHKHHVELVFIDTYNHGCTETGFLTTKWLYSQGFRMSSEIAERHIQAVCVIGRIDIAKWIASSEGPTTCSIRDDEISKAIKTTISNGYEEAATWLSRRYTNSAEANTCSTRTC